MGLVRTNKSLRSSSDVPTLFSVVKLCILCCFSLESEPAVLPSCLCCPLRGKISTWCPMQTWSLIGRVRRPPPSTWRTRTSWSSYTFRRQEVMQHWRFLRFAYPQRNKFGVNWTLCINQPGAYLPKVYEWTYFMFIFLQINWKKHGGTLC